MRTVRVGRQNRAGRAPLDLFHHEERPLKPLQVALEKQGARHRHRRIHERAIRGELDLALGLDQGRDRIAPKDQPALAVLRRIDAHAKRLAARAAVNARQRDHGNPARLRHPVREIAYDALFQIGAHHFAPSMSAVKPLGLCGPMISCSSTP